MSGRRNSLDTDSDSDGDERVRRVLRHVSGVKSSLRDTLVTSVRNGEQLNALEERSKALRLKAAAFRRQSRGLHTRTEKLSCCSRNGAVLRDKHDVIGALSVPSTDTYSARRRRTVLILSLLTTLGAVGVVSALSLAPRRSMAQCQHWLSNTTFPTVTSCFRQGCCFADLLRCEPCVASSVVCEGDYPRHLDPAKACVDDRCARLLQHCFSYGDSAVALAAMPQLVQTLLAAAITLPLKGIARYAFTTLLPQADMEFEMQLASPLTRALHGLRCAAAVFLLALCCTAGVVLFVLGLIASEVEDGWLQMLALLWKSLLSFLWSQVIDVPLVLVIYWVWSRRCCTRPDPDEAAFDRETERLLDASRGMRT